MKKLLALFAFAAILSGCDDGDLIFEDIDFDTVNAARCENKIYKVNGAEALILKLGNSEADGVFVNAFPTEPTIEGTPTIIAIDNATNKVVYRLYDGEVSSTSICGAIPSAFPSILEEWEATSGNIQIVTTAEIIPNPSEGFEGGQKISAYQNNIVFTNVTFQKGDGSTQVYDLFPFGIHSVPATVLNFNFGATALEKCPTGDIVYKFVGTEALTLNLNPTLLDTTNLGVVKSGLITSTVNALNYKLFPSGTAVEESFLCTSPPPVAPLQTWIGIDGVANFSGIVEVVTTTLPGGNGFSHTIRIKKATLKRGRNEFLLADDYLYGELTITN